MGNVELEDCLRTKDDKKFFCKKDDREFFIRGDRYSYSAIEVKKDGSLKAHEVDWIDDNGSPIFYPDLKSGYIFNDEQEDKFNGKLLEFSAINSVIDKSFLSDKNDFAIEDKIKKLFLQNKAKLQSSIKNNDIYIENKNGQKVRCERSKDKQCHILKCESGKYAERYLFFGNNINSSKFDVFDISQDQVSNKSFNAKRLVSETGDVLLERTRTSDYSKTVPSLFRNNANNFMKLVDPKKNTSVQSSINQCGPKLRAKFKKISDHAKKIKNSANMVQYIDIINNEITSFLVNKKSLGDDVCISSGVYYSNEAYKESKQAILKNKGRVVNLKQANDLFKKIKKMESIEWNYTRDGCFARAHLMARELEAQGVKVGKIWARGDLSAVLDGQKESWFYHVAPVIYVKDKKGETKEYVIDPALAKKPLTKKEWLAKMNVNINEVKKRPFPLPDNSKFYGQNVYAITSVEPYDPEIRLGLSEKDKVERANFKMEKFFMGDY